MSKSLLTKIIPFKKPNLLSYGFTLVELLVTATISTLVAGSALYVLNDYHNSSVNSSRRRNLVSSTDNTLRITNEVKQSFKLYPTKASMKATGGGLFGSSTSNACLRLIPDSEFLFALELPDQVMSKGDYYKDINKTDYKSKRIKKFIDSDCNYIFYGVQKNSSSNNGTQGPYSLYRIGYDQNSEGYYNSKSVSKSILNTSISHTLSSPNGLPKSCHPTYHRIVKHGVQICIDKISQRTLHLSLISLDSNSGKPFYYTRSSSASTILNRGGTMFEYNPDDDPCNNAIFLLDISGSMNANMANTTPPKTRIEFARDELIQVVNTCPDNSRVNVLTFNGGSRGSSFKPKLVALNTNIRSQLKVWLGQPEQQPGGGTNPWPQMERTYNYPDPLLNTVHVISDGFISKTGCFLGSCGDVPIIFKSKNDVRDPNPLIINSYSIGDDFCTGNNSYQHLAHYVDLRWMGRIADSCKVVK